MPDNRKPLSEIKPIADRLRKLSIQMTTAAGSGHPSSCMSAADIVADLFFRIMRYDAGNPASPECDKFILSKGHAAPLLYAAMIEAGTLSEEEAMTMRRIDSRVEGHPTPRLPWVQIATGSLGQGLSAGAGMAISIKRFGPQGRRIFVLLGDGEAAEGAVWEAASFASHYRLDNLIAIVDVNRLGQSEPTMLQHDMEKYAARFSAFGWNTLIIDGHDTDEIDSALEKACIPNGRPTAILAKTYKGYGVSFMQDKDDFHGKPLNDADARRALAELNSTPPPPRPRVENWSNPKVRADVSEMEPPAYKKGDMAATREAYGRALVKLGRACPEVVALDGDVKNSTYSMYFAEAYPERFIESYIAEQNMAGVAAGLAAEGKIPFVSSFGAFLLRAADQIRMAGVSMSNIKLCGSHAGVSVGEDGPSQMALEDLGLYRSVPGSIVLYPADAVAAERMVALAAEHQEMAYIRTSRPKVPVIYSNDEKFLLGDVKVHGCTRKDAVTIAGAGVTLYEALKAAARLRESGIGARVIDLYSVKPFPTTALLKHVQETGGRLVVVEDHYPAGGIGEAAAAALAPAGIRVFSLAVSRLPRSGKADELLHYCGIDAEAIIEAAYKLVEDPERLLSQPVLDDE